MYIDSLVRIAFQTPPSSHWNLITVSSADRNLGLKIDLHHFLHLWSISLNLWKVFVDSHHNHEIDLSCVKFKISFWMPFSLARRGNFTLQMTWTYSKQILVRLHLHNDVCASVCQCLYEWLCQLFMHCELSCLTYLLRVVHKLQERVSNIVVRQINRQQSLASE